MRRFQLPRANHAHTGRIDPPIVYVREQPRWEYQQIHYAEQPADSDLNALGDDGWELAAIYPQETGIVMVFKRWQT